ncbi:hypothetical protein [Spongiactinospora sp. TRM90649]|uniref:hypothetical protein n=1 Tax=Spongiactinospora sp. TRM90649 TaxID=3031114 RepID=UPI0023F7D6A4|nr:hypothetical protein [Spongiactinospora sp. TRM90649]MDF5758578.1 hypothetical protein [Spongiactinospora sp. TRM90649]
MADPTMLPGRTMQAARRGKDCRTKRPRPAARAVVDEHGVQLATLGGKYRSDEEVAQALALAKWMPDYTAAVTQ